MTELRSVTIGSSVELIRFDAFLECKNLTKIISKNPIPPLCDEYNVFGRANFNNCTLYVPKGSKSLYQTAVCWKNFVNIEEIDFSAIEDVKADVSLIQYYNLQGVEVENPKYGIYIKRQGSQTTIIKR